MRMEIEEKVTEKNLPSSSFFFRLINLRSIFVSSRFFFRKKEGFTFFFFFSFFLSSFLFLLFSTVSKQRERKERLINEEERENVMNGDKKKVCLLLFFLSLLSSSLEGEERMRMMEKDVEQMEHRNLAGDEMMRMKCVTMDPNGDTRFLSLSSYSLPLSIFASRSQRKRKKEIGKREKKVIKEK